MEKFNSHSAEYSNCTQLKPQTFTYVCEPAKRKQDESKLAGWGEIIHLLSTFPLTVPSDASSSILFSQQTCEID